MLIRHDEVTGATTTETPHVIVSSGTITGRMTTSTSESTGESGDEGSASAEIPSSRQAWLVTATVLFGAFWISSTITILSVSRPEISEDLGASIESLVWLISGPTVAVALFGTTMGKIGDLYGHRRTYLFGMVGATTFVLASAVAWSGLSLIAFRVIGAAVGAATMSSSLAIINRMFLPAQRSKALGFWSLVVAGGPVVGLVVGGPLVEAFGWRMIFWGQAPLLIVATILSWFVVPETERRSSVTFDFRGQAVLFLTLGALFFGIDRSAAWGWTHPGVWVSFALVPLFAWWFVRVERGVDQPLIPVSWFTRREFTTPVLVFFFMQFGYMGGFTITPKLLAEVRDMTPDVISLVMIPRPLTFAIMGPLAGFLSMRIAARTTVLWGLGSLTVSMAVFAIIAPNPQTLPIVIALALSGIGVGATQPRLSALVANAVDNKDLGVAGATQQLFAMVGTAVGMNLLETVQVSSLSNPDALTGWGSLGFSYQVAFAIGAVVTCMGFLVALRLSPTQG